MHVCDIAVSGNVAFNKSTIQSTTYNSAYSTGYSWHAVDGNMDYNWGDGSCSVTGGGETTPWLAVDLGASYTIQYVVLTNEVNQPRKLSDFRMAANS